ncbi:restriction endonuclease subunit S [Helicobacter pylori]|uniref:restriction endonuclease subunit S n=1 Tax=Helicobacter pylori TaxID=210 RepID=UPI00026B2659|nr:restriction endonuclease subunit S [Helicobacter pylori]EJC14924.1 type I restriction modification DNA specificity domain protein [Helicobacter pylori Hp P-25]EJC32761.1 type I restriction modification DNA specificity domain protein [Helicobacter pylori Hp P-25c]EJC38398.1 type I restriction modification DNA specificity domain protein [Helicobacter pylori Hp P-25d]
MIGPLSSQLNAIKWGEFKLGDLFEIYTGSLLSQEDLAKGDIVRISVKSDNNGVYGHFDTLKNKKARHFENFISVNFFGNCFYHPYLASVEMKVHVLKLKNRLLTRRVGLFLANQLNKCFYGQFTYGTQLSSSKLKHNNFKIQLPLKPTANTQTLEDIDFDFMEKFIAELEQCRLAELEQCRLAELEAYLKATGLENTTLSSDEENALSVFNGNNSGGNTPCGLTWQHFKLGDLFEIRPTKAYNLTNSHLFDSNAKNPVVTNSSLNNGISGYSSLEPTEKGNQITYSDTTTSEGIFYQKRPFIGYSHVQGLYPLKYHEFWNEKTLLYIVIVFKKVACGRFNYGNKFNRKIASEMSILLPTNQHGKIDFNFMRTLINALMKQTIQGVVQYSDAKIQATKEVINQEAPVQKDSLF